VELIGFVSTDDDDYEFVRWKVNFFEEDVAEIYGDLEFGSHPY